MLKSDRAISLFGGAVVAILAFLVLGAYPFFWAGIQ